MLRFAIRNFLVGALCMGFGSGSPEPLYAANTATTAAKISHVVWEPNEEAPERIQIHGVFRVSQWPDPDETPLCASDDIFCITEPTAGFVYYWCDPDETMRGQPIALATCVAEWQEIVAMSEAEGCVTFGQNPIENVRHPDSPAVDPDSYKRVSSGHIYGATFVSCDEFESATPQSCGDGIHQAGEACDGNCFADPECGTHIYQCGCGGAQITGSAESCDLSCKTSAISKPNDNDGCCSHPSTATTYCDGGCCLEPDFTPTFPDTDCVPGGFIEIACHSSQDCASGEICRLPNTTSSYCEPGTATQSPDVTGTSPTDTGSEPQPSEDAGTTGVEDAVDSSSGTDSSTETSTQPASPDVYDSPANSGSTQSSSGCSTREGNLPMSNHIFLVLLYMLSAYARRRYRCAD